MFITIGHPRLLFLLLFLVTSVHSNEHGKADNRPDSNSTEAEILGTGEQVADTTSSDADVPLRELERQAFGAQGHERKRLWKKILELNPRSGNAHAQIGIVGLFSDNYAEQVEAVELLERVFDPDKVDVAIPMPSAQGIMLSGMVGRWRWERAEYELARPAIRRAYKATENKDICLGTQLATMLHPYPNSTENADRAIDLYTKNSEYFLAELKKDKRRRINGKKLMQQVGGAGEDPYVHCLLTIFHLSFYYRADVAHAANLHYAIATTLWPQLLYVAPRLKNWSKPTEGEAKPCAKKIRLGVASAQLSLHHSVSSDFKGVLMRLDRSKFDITYIYIVERASPIDDFVYKHNQDKVIILQRSPDDTGTEKWLIRFRKTIEDLDFDVLLYLDLTMSSFVRRMGMARLAKVQATSHGHPLTSGIPRDTVDYFVSWEAAELEYDVAQKHYTEELVLLPKDVPHQYYTKRSNSTHSLIDGFEYTSYVNRKTFFSQHANPPRQDANWYVCMQKPHKFQPEVDPLFCNILSRDPNGVLVLHREERSDLNQERFLQRLLKAGCDADRVFFTGSLPHHRLLALYLLADVVLDSYPAGGCTTTREVLELGKVVVTLPGRLLGGRWSLAYYNIIGDPKLNEMVVADSEGEYVDKAVRLGRDPKYRGEAERRISDSLYNLYGRQESVQSWEKVLLDMAPVSLDESTCVEGSTQSLAGETSNNKK